MWAAVVIAGVCCYSSESHPDRNITFCIFFSREGYSFFARSLSFTSSSVLLCTHSFSPDLGETSRHWGPQCVNATYPGKLIKNRVCLWKKEWVRERKQKEQKKGQKRVRMVARLKGCVKKHLVSLCVKMNPRGRFSFSVITKTLLCH